MIKTQRSFQQRTFFVCLLLSILMLIGMLFSINSMVVSAESTQETVLFTDDMESGVNGWTVSNEAIDGAICLTEDWEQDSTGLNSNSGSTSWAKSITLQSTTGGTCLYSLIAPVVSLPSSTAGISVTFAHKYQTEQGFDGGAVQVSVDGENWASISEFYSGISAGFPLSFDDETVFTPSENLLILPGQDLHVRFAFTYDQLQAEGLGWFVDDVSIIALLGDEPPTPTSGPSPTPTNTPEPGALPNPEVEHGYEFSPIVIVDAQRDVAEPSLRIDPDWNIYACGPFGASRATEYAQKSFDRGDTFRVLGQAPKGQIAPGGGGDCELALGTERNSSGNYTLSYTGLEALVNFSTSRSEDAGESFIGQSAGVVSSAVDRQWMEGYGADVVYLGYNAVNRGYQVARSTDGGLTYDVPVSANPSIFRPGPIRIDPNTAHNPQGNEIVYFSYTLSDGLGISRSLDQGQTWEHFVVATGFNANNLFAGLAIDTAGNLYTTWSEKGSFNTYYAYSLRGENGAGEVWSEKRLVNRNPINSTVMPWIEAGDPGRISVSYYGAANDGNIEDGNFNAEWHVYLSTSFNALDDVDANGHVPFDLTKVTTHPIHWDSICTSGLGCSLSVPAGDRTLLDFFQNRVTSEGGIIIVYNQSNKIPTAEVGRLAIVSFSRQTAGPSLYTGSMVTADNRPNVRTSSADPVDDAIFPISAFGAKPLNPSQIPAMEITNLELVEVADAPVDGTFEIQLTLEDASIAAMDNALIAQGSSGSPAASLLFVVRWFSGTDAYSAVAKYNGISFSYGFNDLSFATVEGSKLETYPGDDKTIPGEIDGNTIKMTVSPADFNVLLPGGVGEDPTFRPATSGDRIYSVTAYAFGNAGAPETQEYLNDVDVTAAFDYILPGGVPTAVQMSQPIDLLANGSAPDSNGMAIGATITLLLVLTALGVTFYLAHQRRRNQVG